MAGLTRYSCKRSKKVFTQHALFFVLLLKEKFQYSYRRIAEEIRNLNLWRCMGLRRAPHYTTLQKFCERLDLSVFNELINVTGGEQGDTIIGDCTNYTLTNPSHHYVSVIRKFMKKKNFTIKSPFKLAILANHETRKIINANTSIKRAHDTTLIKPLINQLENNKTFIYDKGLDSKEIRNQIIRKESTPIIPYRKNNKHKKGIPIETYHKRSIIESIISSIKRKYGNNLKNHKPTNQTKQTITKIIQYNLDKTNIFLIKILQKICFLHCPLTVKEFKHLIHSKQS